MNDDVTKTKEGPRGENWARYQYPEPATRFKSSGMLRRVYRQICVVADVCKGNSSLTFRAMQF